MTNVDNRHVQDWHQRRLPIPSYPILIIQYSNTSVYIERIVKETVFPIIKSTSVVLYKALSNISRAVAVAAIEYSQVRTPLRWIQMGELEGVVRSCQDGEEEKEAGSGRRIKLDHTSLIGNHAYYSDTMNCTINS